MPQVPDVPLDGLYGELIIDHSRNPRHHVSLPDADVDAEEFNPFCGDRIAVQLKLSERERVLEVGARTEGCSIIRASASMMADASRGKTVEQLQSLAQQFRDMMRSKPPWEATEAISGDLEALKVVRQFPVRIKCALLPWTALEEGIDAYRSSQTRDQ